jgi:4-hydroxy-tetrahydrodipicolinate synthase
MQAIKNSIVALVTPFKKGEIDELCIQNLAEWHVEQGTSAIVSVGTTGESPTLSHEEHERVVALVIEAVAGRIPVIAGVGSNATAETLRLAKHAQKVGADVGLVVTPYYNKPSQKGIIEHFQCIHDNTDLPIIIYNIPSRSVVDISLETMAILSEFPRIIGVKDATGIIERVSQQRHLCKKGFIQLSGEDITALAFNAHGGAGCISVTANVAPAICTQFQESMERGDFSKALEIQDKLVPLHQALFLEPNPAPVKYALSLIGKCSDEVRLPMIKVSPVVQEAIKKAMNHAGLLV